MKKARCDDGPMMPKIQDQAAARWLVLFSLNAMKS